MSESVECCHILFKLADSVYKAGAMSVMIPNYKASHHIGYDSKPHSYCHNNLEHCIVAYRVRTSAQCDPIFQQTKRLR
jgi:hypothetical protein